LASHATVANVAVIGIPDVKWGEKVVAFVQQSPHAKEFLTEKDMKLWLRKHDLAPHKMPDHFILTSEETGLPTGLPVNASGKVLKTELRTRAQVILNGVKSPN
jgi:acyl-CoA synthetase (AMP-forming)/AMP-acid ligase II